MSEIVKALQLRLRPETHKKVLEVKTRLGFSSFNATAQHLLDRAVNDESLIARQYRLGSTHCNKMNYKKIEDMEDYINHRIEREGLVIISIESDSNGWTIWFKKPLNHKSTTTE